jgi:hypothetical protein
MVSGSRSMLQIEDRSATRVGRGPVRSTTEATSMFDSSVYQGALGLRSNNERRVTLPRRGACPAGAVPGAVRQQWPVRGLRNTDSPE